MILWQAKKDLKFALELLLISRKDYLRDIANPGESLKEPVESLIEIRTATESTQTAIEALDKIKAATHPALLCWLEWIGYDRDEPYNEDFILSNFGEEFQTKIVPQLEEMDFNEYRLDEGPEADIDAGEYVRVVGINAGIDLEWVVIPLEPEGSPTS